MPRFLRGFFYFWLINLELADILIKFRRAEFFVLTFSVIFFRFLQNKISIINFKFILKIKISNVKNQYKTTS